MEPWAADDDLDFEILKSERVRVRALSILMVGGAGRDLCAQIALSNGEPLARLQCDGPLRPTTTESRRDPCTTCS